MNILYIPRPSSFQAKILASDFSPDPQWVWKKQLQAGGREWPKQFSNLVSPTTTTKSRASLTSQPKYNWFAIPISQTFASRRAITIVSIQNWTLESSHFKRSVQIKKISWMLHLVWPFSNSMCSTSFLSYVLLRCKK